MYLQGNCFALSCLKLLSESLTLSEVLIRGLHCLWNVIDFRQRSVQLTVVQLNPGRAFLKGPAMFKSSIVILVVKLKFNQFKSKFAILQLRFHLIPGCAQAQVNCNDKDYTRLPVSQYDEKQKKLFIERSSAEIYYKDHCAMSFLCYI